MLTLLIIGLLGFVPPIASEDSWISMEPKSKQLVSGSATHRICKQSDLIRKFRNKISRSEQKTIGMNASIATQNAIALINSTRSFRVDEGSRNREFILKFQREIIVKNEPLLINIWIDSEKYFEQTRDNNLNSKVFGAGNQPGRITDRDNTINEIGKILSEVIVPESIAAFGPVKPVSNSLSDGFNVLIYDISDNFEFTSSFIGGYFDPDDKFNPNNNRMNAIHMDMYPSNPGGNNINISAFIPALPRKDFYQVLAHEFQHLIHAQFDLDETMWVNEGFSQYAIYRTLFNKKFSNGNALINAPEEGPSQVPFWLADPSSSQLISSDEPGIQGKLFQRNDSAELRGIGYLFFTYLWEQLGGRVSNGTLDGSLADQNVNSMIQSSATGIASIQSGLNASKLNFNDLFNSFSVALNADGINALYNLEFVNFSSNNQLHIANTVIANASLAPLSFNLAGYDFQVIGLNGGAKHATLKLSSSSSFYAYLLEGDAPQSRSLKQDLTGLQNSVFVAANSKNVLILSNPSLQQISVQLSYLNDLAFVAQPAETVQASTENLEMPPIVVNGFEIISQNFTNSTSIALDILNDQPNGMALSACAAGSNCISASHLRVPDRSPVRFATVKINNKDYFFSNLSLEPGQTYDLYYANKTSQSLQINPVVTRTAVVLSNSANPPLIPPQDLPVSAGSGSGGAGGCFLASASFLGKQSSEVLLLSRFRDQLLLKYDIGQMFVDFYYKYSPSLADWISGQPFVGLMCQFILMPLILLLALFYHSHWILLILILIPLGLPKRSSY